MQQTPITLTQVAAACDRFGIPTTQFGREAIGDPRLVRDLRNGRVLRPATMQRVREYIAALGAVPCSLQPHTPPIRRDNRLTPEAPAYEHASMMRQGSAKLLAAILAAKGEC